MQVDVLGILLGWLFGLLSPGIAARISRTYRRRELTDALLAEVDEMRPTLALSLFSVRAYLHSVDPTLASRISATMATYRGAKGQSGQLQFLRDPAVLLQAFATQPSTEGRALALEPCSLPLLSASLTEITMCDADLQRRLLHIKAELELYNSDVTWATNEVGHAFDGQADAIRSEFIAANLRQHYARLATHSDVLLQAATELLNRHRH